MRGKNPPASKGPQFLEYMPAIIDTLKENGGSGSASDIIDKVINRLNISESKVEETLPSGESRVRNRIQWARFYLAKAGLIDTEKRGVWQLTQEGFNSSLNPENSYQLFRAVHKEFENSKGEKNNKKEKRRLIMIS